MLKYCSAPWTTIHIDKFGLISSCFCNAWHQKGYNGNILTTPLQELFNNDWQEEFKQSILNQSFSWCRSDSCVDFYRMEPVENWNFLPKIPQLPTTIQLQIDRNCNLKCEICRQTNIYSPEVKSTAYSILERLTEEYKIFDQKVNLHCDGSGDVFASAAYLKFFNRDDLPKCFHFNIQTNGNLLTKNTELIYKLKTQIEMVEVSLDAATDKTCKLVRGGNFEQVINGIKLLKELGIKVWTQYVVYQKNYLEILDYVKLCKHLGVDKICLQSVSKMPHMTGDWWTENALEENKNIDYKFLLSAIEQLKQDPQIEVSGGFEYLLENKKVINLHPL
jgi:MoaA/NifB/PqqE/SkfB family radical SAM enzyme